ncbi:MAG: MFS transporter [Muribaculaceae bacterium]|nr:MFS transporter [Muribaculaceae bacterium]
MAFLFMWTYTNGTVAKNAFDCPTTLHADKVEFMDNGMLVSHKAKFVLNAADSALLISNGKELVDINALPQNSTLLFANIMGEDPQTHKLYLDEVNKVTLPNPASVTIVRKEELNTDSEEYNAAGNWVGILFAVQALGSVVWALVLPRFRSRKFSYALSLLLGGAGFITAGLFTDPYLLFVSFVLIGCAWAAMLAWPFTILTNSLKGGNIGAYLGLFNCTITIPQIIGALIGGTVLGWFGSANGLAPQYVMMLIAGGALIVGAFCVIFIREKATESDVPLVADAVNNE